MGGAINRSQRVTKHPKTARARQKAREQRRHKERNRRQHNRRIRR